MYPMVNRTTTANSTLASVFLKKKNQTPSCKPSGYEKTQKPFYKPQKQHGRIYVVSIRSEIRKAVFRQLTFVLKIIRLVWAYNKAKKYKTNSP